MFNLTASFLIPSKRKHVDVYFGAVGSRDTERIWKRDKKNHKELSMHVLLQLETTVPRGKSIQAEDPILIQTLYHIKFSLS